MSPKEKKELVGYLKKETDRLDKAIRNANKTKRLGRVAQYEQLRDAFASALNKLITGNKNLFLMAAMFCWSAFTTQPSDTMLAGKIFAIEVSEKPAKETKSFQYQITFKDDKLFPIAIGLKSRQDSLPAGFSPGAYSRTVDSSDAVTTIIFSSLSKKKDGETLLWLGYVEGDNIQGAVHWSGGKNKYKVFTFFGKLKYLKGTEGKF